MSTSLSQHGQQLHQLNQLLQQQPDNLEFIQLKSEIEHLIELEKQLAQSAVTVSAPVPIPSTLPTASSSTVSQPTASALSLFSAGERCNAVWPVDQHYYPARIDEYDEKTQLYTVTYLQYGNQEQLTLEQLKPYVIPSAELLHANVAVQVLDPEIQLFVDAVIVKREDEAGKRRYAVRLKHADQHSRKRRLVVEAADLQLKLNSNSETAKSSSFTITLPTQVVIPDSLVIRSNDSETTKQHKLKQIKRLKSDFKRSQQLAEGEKRKANWLEFQQQQSKRRKGASLSAVVAANKGSIFATSDEPHTRIGVVHQRTAVNSNKTHADSNKSIRQL